MSDGSMKVTLEVDPATGDGNRFVAEVVRQLEIRLAWRFEELFKQFFAEEARAVARKALEPKVNEIVDRLCAEGITYARAGDTAASTGRLEDIVQRALGRPGGPITRLTERLESRVQTLAYEEVDKIRGMLQATLGKAVASALTGAQVAP